MRAPTLPLLFALTAGCLTKDEPADDTGPIETTDVDGDGYSAPADCDDEDAAINPGAAEACDGVDNNCDGTADEGVTLTFFADGDGDGYGDPSATTEACEAPSGYTADSTDCDDANAEVYPGAAERCEGLDNDCDSAVDEDVQSQWYADSDGDNFGDAAAPLESCDPPGGYVADSTDCDDDEPASFPGNPEACDELDNDCDVTVDEGVTTTYYVDSDADGFGSSDATTQACDTPTGYADDDDDCDDGDASINPDADERCDNVDNDCDGDTDEDSAVDAPTWYIDADADGYGSTSYTDVQCTQPAGYVANANDCDDLDRTSHPGGTETCDQADNDCDNTVDESPSDGTLYYADSDADGYGDPNTSQRACSQPTGYTTDDQDCYDADADAYPGSHETETPLDGVDTDCDGLDVCTDLNCDGWPDLFIGDHYDGNYTTTSYAFFFDGAAFSDSDRTGLPTYGAYDVEVADLDDDGYNDIVIANYHNDITNSIDSYIYWGSAAGYSTSDRTELPTEGGLKVTIDDVDQDGYLDLWFLNYYNGTYALNSYLYWGSSSGYSPSDRTVLPTQGAWETRIEDLDSDGYKDIVVCNHYNASYFIDSYIYWGSSSGWSSSDRTGLPTLGCRDLEIEDFNADGYPDIAFANHYNGSYNIDSYLYYGTSSGYSTAYRDSFPTNGTLGVTSGDFDNDGYIDLVFGGYHSGSWSSAAYTRVFMNSSAGFSASVYDQFETRGSYYPEAADLDRDGYDDLVIPVYYNGTSHSATSYVYWGDASGLSNNNRTDLPTLGASKVDIGDVNGDGYPEIVFNNYHTGSWSTSADTYVYYGTTAGYSTANRDELGTHGSWPFPVLVGLTDW
ncbi:MAG: VCBS repeat-containing protein [Alphaproteobacteria bacterium]|nr:VCBS repeat-containing protein [Alphaproteobacteria bacterium]